MVERVVAGLHEVGRSIMRHDARSVRWVHYVLGQQAQLRHGVRAIVCSVLVIALPEPGTFVALVHLRQGSLRVETGDPVVTGQHLADCGNSGISTQPHVHLQDRIYSVAEQYRLY
jgi:murein DD-endopeptidase MepM/ murein hydrolase activator NlpD